MTHVSTMTGKVVKRSGDKTVAVEIVSRRQHPRYGKIVQKAKIYLVHDPRNEATVGQVVTIRETRPLSKRKRWLVMYEKV